MDMNEPMELRVTRPAFEGDDWVYTLKGVSRGVRYKATARDKDKATAFEKLMAARDAALSKAQRG